MRKVQNTAKSNSNGGIDGTPGASFDANGWNAEFDEDIKYKHRKRQNNQIIKLANTKVNLLNYIKQNIKINFEITPSASGWDHKACCPFKDHKDDSPSFFVNSKDNSFKCFGCGKGGGSVYFIASYYDRDIIDVAESIISKYDDLNSIYDELQDQSDEEVDNLITDFNNYIRKFLHQHKTSVHFDKCMNFVENLMWSIDIYIEKHYTKRSEMSLENLSERIRVIKTKLNTYE